MATKFIMYHFQASLVISLIYLVLIKEAVSQDCLTPTIVHGHFAGDTIEDGTAAVLCTSGYVGGGTATCSGGVWTVLPSCAPKDCGTTNVANGVLLGDTFYGGNAVINCNVGYEGGGTSICGSGGTWTSLPGCNAIDCGPTGITNGNNVGDTFYGGAPFVVCNIGYTGGGNTLTCLQSGDWDIQTICRPKSCGTPTVGNAIFSGDNFYSGTAEIVCDAGYAGGGPATCLISGQWNILPTCIADCGIPTITNGKLATGSQTTYGGTAMAECNAGYNGGGDIICQSSGDWTANPNPCAPVDCGMPIISHGNLTGSTVFEGTASVECETGYKGGGSATCLSSGVWDSLPACLSSGVLGKDFLSIYVCCLYWLFSELLRL